MHCISLVKPRRISAANKVITLEVTPLVINSWQMGESFHVPAASSACCVSAFCLVVSSLCSSDLSCSVSCAVYGWVACDH